MLYNRGSAEPIVPHDELTIKRKTTVKLSHRHENYATITKLAPVMMTEIWILEWCAIYMLFSTRTLVNHHGKSKQQHAKFDVTTAGGCVARLFVSSEIIRGTSTKCYTLRFDLVTITNPHYRKTELPTQHRTPLSPPLLLLRIRVVNSF